MKEALGPLKAPICPHLRLNDARVSDVYLQTCPRPQWIISRGYTLGAFVCNYCGTVILFHIESKVSGTDALHTDALHTDALHTVALHLVVARSIRHTWRCTDLAWIGQVADRADFEEYEQAWRTTNAECQRRMQ